MPIPCSGTIAGEKKVSVSRCARTTQGMLEVADYLEPSLTAVACGSLEADSDRPESYGAISQQTGKLKMPQGTYRSAGYAWRRCLY
ncbi:TPA: hypothetical protein ACH3X1_005285 [Trebouxia sp. C0004]